MKYVPNLRNQLNPELMKGKAIVFSAPSGSGKTTIVQSLLLQIPTLSFSISATSRKKRENEIDGKDYYFLSEYDFRKKIDNSEFVEWEEVYDGCFYGTLKTEVDRIWVEGKTVVFDVDVKGGLNLKKLFGQSALAIFIRVQDTGTLKERLGNRETETKESLGRRLDKAEFEITFQHKFDRIIMNDELNKAVSEAESLVKGFLKT